MSSAATAATGGFSERFVERVGPIVVKEVRQGLRSRVFAIFFGTLLAACLVMALIALAEATNSAGTAHGKDFFGAYLTALGGVCFFVLPFVAFRSMARELEDETWVLLTLTGLGPGSITRGKWASIMSQALLFGSACAPFVLFSYFLNGIDLVQIVVALVLAAAWSSFLTAVGIAVATQAHTKLGRTVAHFVVLGLLGLATVGGVAFAWVLAEEGQRLLTTDALRNFAIGIGVFSLLGTWLVLEGAAAGLALPSEPASRGPRIALAILGALGIGFGLVLFVIENGRATDAEGGQIVTMFLLTCIGPFCISERDGWPVTAASGGWLKPGALRSFLLILTLMVASSVMWSFCFSNGRSSSWGSDDKHVRAMIGALAYPVMYLSFGVILGRLSPLKRLGEPVATRAGFILSVVLGVVLSLLVSLLLDNRANSRLFNALNPVVGLVNLVDRSGSDLDAAVTFASAVALLAVFVALMTLWTRDEVRK
ncbi:MAG: ABC transporter permease [Myxococcaceae bacterium]